MDFNPIQMGAAFASWYMSDIEIKVRSIVDELSFRYGHDEVPIDAVTDALESWGIKYEYLPQSCKDMIDELEVC